MAVYLGIDVGTTAVKAALFAADGAVVGSATVEYVLSQPAPDAVELDAEVYWSSCCTAVRRALAAAGIDPQSVRALAVSSQAETIIPVDGDGRPARPALVWLDNRPAAEAALIEAEFGAPAAFRITGQPQVAPTWPACKILWLKRNDPQAYRAARRFLLVEDFVLHRLTGGYWTERSLQSSSLMLDINSGQWWPEMLAYLDITPAQLGELANSGDVVGALRPEAAAALGLPPGVTVVAGTLDQVAAAVGAGNVGPGVVSETTGGVLGLVATVKHPVFDPKARVPCHVHALPGAYCLLPWGQTAGMALRWFRDEIWAGAGEPGGYEEITAAAAEVPPGAEGLLALPHLEGAACPEFNPHAKGVFFGVTLRHGRAHFARAILESVAYLLRGNLELLAELGAPAVELLSMGGGARSDLWLQIKADVTGLPVTEAGGDEASCRGAAMLAAVATGEFEDLRQAADAMAYRGRQFLPRPENRAVYDDGFLRYGELYRRLEPMFR
ncbi:MAG: hypothetical protein HPY83_16065 [Anaerolineae bacterium]|nr:hypothetical protein [Anaerolineae bacterium]